MQEICSNSSRKIFVVDPRRKMTKNYYYVLKNKVKMPPESASKTLVLIRGCSFAPNIPGGVKSVLLANDSFKVVHSKVQRELPKMPFLEKFSVKPKL